MCYGPTTHVGDTNHEWEWRYTQSPEISGKLQLTVSIEDEAKRLSRYTKCDMTPRVSSFYNEILAFWRDPASMRREKAEQTARAALEKCFDAGMTLQDISALWDEVQVKKVHDE